MLETPAKPSEIPLSSQSSTPTPISKPKKKKKKKHPAKATILPGSLEEKKLLLEPDVEIREKIEFLEKLITDYRGIPQTKRREDTLFKHFFTTPNASDSLNFLRDHLEFIKNHDILLEELISIESNLLISRCKKNLKESEDLTDHLSFIEKEFNHYMSFLGYENLPFVNGLIVTFTTGIRINKCPLSSPKNTLENLITTYFKTCVQKKITYPTLHQVKDIEEKTIKFLKTIDLKEKINIPQYLMPISTKAISEIKEKLNSQKISIISAKRKSKDDYEKIHLSFATCVINFCLNEKKDIQLGFANTINQINVMINIYSTDKKLIDFISILIALRSFQISFLIFSGDYSEAIQKSKNLIEYFSELSKDKRFSIFKNLKYISEKEFDDFDLQILDAHSYAELSLHISQFFLELSHKTTAPAIPEKNGDDSSIFSENKEKSVSFNKIKQKRKEKLKKQKLKMQKQTKPFIRKKITLEKPEKISEASAPEISQEPAPEIPEKPKSPPLPELPEPIIENLDTPTEIKQRDDEAVDSSLKIEKTRGLSIIIPSREPGLKVKKIKTNNKIHKQLEEHKKKTPKLEAKIQSFTTKKEEDTTIQPDSTRQITGQLQPPHPDYILPVLFPPQIPIPATFFSQPPLLPSFAPPEYSYAIPPYYNPKPDILNDIYNLIRSDSEESAASLTSIYRDENVRKTFPIFSSPKGPFQFAALNGSFHSVCVFLDLGYTDIEKKFIQEISYQVKDKFPEIFEEINRHLEKTAGHRYE